MIAVSQACSTSPPAPSSGAYPLRNPPRFIWPGPNGKLSSRFGIRNGVKHDGVDIAAPAGTPVLAAARGEVIYVGRMRGYGNIIIVQHDGRYATVYAHISKNSVRQGQRVACGQMIGRVGRSGRTSGANLHFEVRHNNVASNPLALLPAPPADETRIAAGIGSY